ncbi:MAG TPA: Holliday junction resolvase-like protein [Candidatus Nanoarchaeia archaeon]|nr:Holliday junction resolvase-like protein [Candidatus Nanoarchaeia archaeon]
MNLQILLIAILILIVIFLAIRLYYLKMNLSKMGFDYRSMYVKHGKNWENFAPFMKEFPGKKENFRFIGNPIDGIVFDEDEIKFVEIKTGKSNLNEKQKSIKSLVDNKKISFHELRF